MAKVEDPQAQYGFQEPKKERVSLETYLEMIADGTRRLEYHDGVVVDIQSATEAHGMICTNLVALLKSCLREKGCKLYAADREIWIPKCNKIFYPDLIAVCGEQRFKQMSKNVEATINPSVVIEVLSESTQKNDLGPKGKCYKTLESLNQIAIIWQDTKFITLKQKDEKGNWIETEYSEDDDEIEIGGCKIKIQDVYQDIEFEITPERASDL